MRELERDGKPVVILVEGVDNTGKSTLCTTLEEIYDVPIYHSPVGRIISPTDRKAMRELAKRYISIDYRIILDRCCMVSDQVYGPVLRGKSCLRSKEWKELWYEFLDKRQPIVISCRPHDKPIIGTISERLQYPGVAFHIEKLIAQYDLRMNKVACDISSKHNGSTFVEYDYTKDPECKKLVETLAQRRKK